MWKKNQSGACCSIWRKAQQQKTKKTFIQVCKTTLNSKKWTMLEVSSYKLYTELKGCWQCSFPVDRAYSVTLCTSWISILSFALTLMFSGTMHGMSFILYLCIHLGGTVLGSFCPKFYNPVTLVQISSPFQVL